MRTRRDFIWQTGGGFAGIALLDLLTRDNYFGRTVSANSIDANPIVLHHYFWDTILIEIVHEQLLPSHRALRFESGLRH